VNLKNAMRRVGRVVVDVIDGVLAAVLYSRQGSLPNTLPDLEHLNESKIRTWSAGSSSPQVNETPASAIDEMKIDERIAAFRARTKRIEK